MKKMEDRMHLAKTKLGAMLDAKDEAIHTLKQQVERQMEVTQQEKDYVNIQELEEYVHIQEEHYADQMAKVLEKSKMHMEVGDAYGVQAPQSTA